MSDSADLLALKHLYEFPGPFVTVCLDGTRSTESGEHEVELRWRVLRDRLTDADERDLDALGEAIAADRAPGRHGLVLVAGGGEVLFTGTLDDAPARGSAAVGRLPHLMTYLAGRIHHVPHLLVLADRTGADIGVATKDDVHVADSVESDRYPVHRTGRDVWSEWHFHSRVEDTWEANARDVAADVMRRARQDGCELVVLAGDERATAMIRDELAAAGGPPVTEVSGTRPEHDPAGNEKLVAGVRDALLHHVWAQRREVLEHLQQNLGRERYAVAGVSDVVAALRQGQADTVVLSNDPSSTLRAWIGPQPLDLALDREELTATGVAEPVEDRFDAALLRAVVGSGARLLLTPNAHDFVADGIAALLRYDTSDTGTAAPQDS